MGDGVGRHEGEEMSTKKHVLRAKVVAVILVPREHGIVDEVQVEHKVEWHQISPNVRDAILKAAIPGWNPPEEEL